MLGSQSVAASSCWVRDQKLLRRTHTHTHRNTHTHSHTQKHKHTHTCAYTHRCRHAYTHMRAHKHIHTHMHTCTHTQRHAHTNTHAQAHTNKHAHTCTHTRMHKHTHTHAHKYTHKSTCQACISPLVARQKIRNMNMYARRYTTCPATRPCHSGYLRARNGNRKKMRTSGKPNTFVGSFEGGQTCHF